MSNPVRQFKRIGTDTPEPVSLSVPEPIAVRLDALAVELTEKLGFDVSPENAIGWLLQQVRPVTKPVVTLPDPNEGMSPMDIEARDLVRQGKKIHAIKLVRERTGMGLKEAKDYVESRWWMEAPKVTP